MVMEENEYIVRLRGLPWSSKFEDVKSFLDGCNIKGGESGIHLTYLADGRATGEAFVELESEEDVPNALEKNKKHIGKRYIDVFRVKRSEMEYALKKAHHPSSRMVRNRDAVVRLRGLPFGCSKEEVANFFSGLEIAPNGITFLTDHINRSTGDAFVQFISIESVEKAVLKHKECIGHRYIEVFQSSSDELMSTLARSCRQKAMMMMNNNPRGGGPMGGGSFLPHQQDFFGGGGPGGFGPMMGGFNPFGPISRGSYGMGRGVGVRPQRALQYGRGDNSFNNDNDYFSPDFHYQGFGGGTPGGGLNYNGDGYPSGSGRFDPWERRGGAFANQRGGGRGGSFNGGPRFQQHSNQVFNGDGGFLGGGGYNSQHGGYGSHQQGGGFNNRGGMRGNGAKRMFVGGYRNKGNNQQTRHESVTGYSVHMRGLPFSITEEEIVEFFQPLHLVNIVLHKNSNNRPTGDADIDFVCHEAALDAMKKNRAIIKKRYIELFLKSSPYEKGDFAGHQMNNRAIGCDYTAF